MVSPWIPVLLKDCAIVGSPGISPYEGEPIGSGWCRGSGMGTCDLMRVQGGFGKALTTGMQNFLQLVAW